MRGLNIVSAKVDEKEDSLFNPKKLDATADVPAVPVVDNVVSEDVSKE